MRENHTGWGRPEPEGVGFTGNEGKFGFHCKKSLEGSDLGVL